MYRAPYTPEGSDSDVPVRHHVDGGFPDEALEEDRLGGGAPLPATWREPVTAQGLVRTPAKGVPVIHTDDAGAVVPDRAVELRQGPWSLLLSTALQTAPAGFQEELVEDALLRRSDAALSTDDEVRLRPLADQVAMLETEYLAAGVRYHEAENDAPKRGDWHNPQHYLEAMKVHERRMDRLQRGVRDAHERLTRAVLVLDKLRNGDAPPSQGGGGGSGTQAVGVAVEVEHAGGERSRTRIVTRS